MIKTVLRKLKEWARSLQGRSSLALLITAAVLIQVNSTVQYLFTRNGITKEVQQRARTEMKVKNLEIMQVVSSVETAVRNMAWTLEQQLNAPDSIYALERKLLAQNDMLIGCGIGYEAGHFPQQGRWFEPYVLRLRDGTFEARQIGGEKHDYLNAPWFLDGFSAAAGHWSEPYLDEEGAHDMVCTYSYPLRDRQGRTVALLGVDVSLGWLADMFSAPAGVSQASVLVSRKGSILACPDKTLVMKTTVDDISEQFGSPMIKQVNSAMLSSDSGYALVTNDNGEKSHVYYAPVKGGTGWSMVVVFDDKAIYHGLHALGSHLFLLMLLGLGLMIYIMYRTVQGFKRLQAVNAEKERIGSELRIASGIQMGMLPKTFPPYPDLDEVSIFGALVSAKEVGGDLYDFYVRDGQLFFCIGDVSGKGVPSSLVMAVTRSLFRSTSANENDPAKVMSFINNAMAEMNDSSMFVTLFIGNLNLQNGLLHYSNAGHCPAVILGESVTQLPVDANIPVGLMSDWSFTGQQTTIQPGNLIFLYTDGLTEAENQEHQLFGENRMMEALSHAARTPHAIIDTLNESISAFVGDAEQSDDLTMLAIQLNNYMDNSKTSDSTRRITLPNDVNAVPQLAAFIEEVAESHGADPSVTMNIDLALEEAVVNVMNYAYPEGTFGEVDVTACFCNGTLIFTVSDSGIPFDPTKVSDPDTSLSAEERPIGGLGIHLVRQLMDEVAYCYENNHNILTLKKKIK